MDRSNCDAADKVSKSEPGNACKTESHTKLLESITKDSIPVWKLPKNHTGKLGEQKSEHPASFNFKPDVELLKRFKQNPNRPLREAESGKSKTGIPALEKKNSESKPPLTEKVKPPASQLLPALPYINDFETFKPIPKPSKAESLTVKPKAFDSGRQKGAEIQKLLESNDWQELKGKSEVPASVLALLGKIADKNERMNGSDFILDLSLPSKSLTFAMRNEDHLLVSYKTGGIALRSHVELFKLSGDKASSVYKLKNCAAPLDDIHDLRKAVASSGKSAQCRD